ncbi:UNVERIFIED_CONTAM: hypothetical protein FKN15_052742 [Acipenser sinensis]
MEEILQRSHRKCEVPRQVAVLLPPRAPAWGRSNRWQAPPTQTVTRTVPVPMALLGDLRHRVQDTTTANNQALPKGRGNAGRGQPTHQRPRRQFQGHDLGSHSKLPHHNLSSPTKAPEGLRPPFSARLHFGHLSACHCAQCLCVSVPLPPFRGITNTFLTDPLQALVLQKEVAALLCKRATFPGSTASMW